MAVIRFVDGIGYGALSINAFQNYSINYWIDGGVPRRKIVMGMPMYGQGFTLTDPKKHDLNDPAPGMRSNTQISAFGIINNVPLHIA